MNDAPPRKTPKSNGKKRLPETLAPEVTLAVVEDAVLGAAADLAATIATMDEEMAVILAETPQEEEMFELLSVPYLGRTRVRSLADAGIRTLDDLRAVTVAEIGGVKGVGMRNAERIKEWLVSQATTVITLAPVPKAVSPDLELAMANQAVQDDMAQIDAAITRIQASIPDRIAHKKLDRQMDKLLAVLSELAEGPDTLRPKQMRRALKMLHLIASLLDKFADVGHLSEKIVVAFAEELRDRRKRLQEVLDPAN